MDYLQNIVWTMSSLCRGDPKPPTNVTSKMVFPLVSLLDQGISTEVTIDILWALNYLSDHDEKQLDLVVGSGVAHKLIRLLEDDKFKRGRGAIPVVKILGNFVAGDEIQTQTAIDSGILNHLSWLLGNKKKALRKRSGSHFEGTRMPVRQAPRKALGMAKRRSKQSKRAYYRRQQR